MDLKECKQVVQQKNIKQYSQSITGIVYKSINLTFEFKFYNKGTFFGSWKDNEVVGFVIFSQWFI